MKLRILLSFHYYRKTDVARLSASFPEPPEIFADSGAFSAYTQGAEVTLDDYAGWLDRWRDHFAVYANLDSIGDPVQTQANQAALEALGFTPLPVFHTGGPWDVLTELCERYPYIALGGMVGQETKAVLRWAVACFRHAQKTGTVFHGFGQTSVPVLKALPWYSVDSSSWGSGHRYGQLSLWDDKRARFVQVQVGDHKAIYALAPLIRAHGGDPAQLAQHRYSSVRDGVEIEEVRRERAHIISVNVAAWLRLEEWLQQRHGPVPGPGQVGPRVYLADSRGSPKLDERQDLAIAAQGLKVYLADTGAPTATANLLAAAKAVADEGPKVYLAEGVERNLRSAAQAVSDTRGATR